MSGSSYEGGFVQGKYDGVGIYTWPDGSTLQAGWSAGLRTEAASEYKDKNGVTWRNTPPARLYSEMDLSMNL